MAVRLLPTSRDGGGKAGCHPSSMCPFRRTAPRSSERSLGRKARTRQSSLQKNLCTFLRKRKTLPVAFSTVSSQRRRRGEALR